MRKILLPGFFLFLTNVVFSQNIGVNTTGVAADVSAILDVLANNKGMLIPRVALTSTTDAVTIATPAPALFVYNTATAGVSPNNVIPGFYYNSGTAGAPVWTRLANGNGSSWLLLGNAGTSAVTNFLGTTDAVDFVTRTNNIERMRILSGGNVGIGISAPIARLDIQGPVARTGSTGTSPSFYVSGTLSTGQTGPASGNVEFRHDNGTQGIGFGYNTIYQTGSNANQDLNLLSRGSGPLTLNAFPYSTGNVGVGVTNPAYNFEINGTFGYGNGTAGAYRSRTETRNDAGQMATQSGFYETSAPAPAADWPTGAASWWHLLDIRHSNNANNYAMQFSGSFFDQKLYFRKTNNASNQAWSEILTSSTASLYDWTLLGNAGTNAAVNFIGTTDAVDWVMRTSNTERARITAAGNYGIGIAAPTQRLDVQGGNARVNNTFLGDVGYGATWGAFSHSSQNTTSGYAVLESNDGAYTLINKLNTGTGYIGFRVSNVDQAVITNAGNMGIQTTTPQVRLAVNGSGVNVYATDAWIEDNMHVQGNEALVVGGRGRLRVGTAWGYVGMYADANSLGAGNDLVLGASSGTTRVGCTGCTTQNLLVNGSLTVFPTANTFTRIISGGAGSYLGVYTDALYNGTATAPTFTYDGMTLSSVGTTFGDVSYSSENTGGWHYWIIGGTRRMRLDQFSNLYLNAGTFNTAGADVAEEFSHDGSLEEGDVVMIDADGENEIKLCDKPKSSKVFGVISTAPGVLLNSGSTDEFDKQMEANKPKDSKEREQKWVEFKNEHKKKHLPVALNGRTPCKVVATTPIKKGDFITSASRAGYGEKLVGPGSYFAIALEDMPGGTGKIMVVMKSGYTNE